MLSRFGDMSNVNNCLFSLNKLYPLHHYSHLHPSKKLSNICQKMRGKKSQYFDRVSAVSNVVAIVLVKIIRSPLCNVEKEGMGIFTITWIRKSISWWISFISNKLTILFNGNKFVTQSVSTVPCTVLSCMPGQSRSKKHHKANYESNLVNYLIIQKISNWTVKANKLHYGMIR